MIQIEKKKLFVCIMIVRKYRNSLHKVHKSKNIYKQTEITNTSLSWKWIFSKLSIRKIYITPANIVLNMPQTKKQNNFEHHYLVWLPIRLTIELAVNVEHWLGNCCCCFFSIILRQSSVLRMFQVVLGWQWGTLINTYGNIFIQNILLAKNVIYPPL